MFFTSLELAPPAESIFQIIKFFSLYKMLLFRFFVNYAHITRFSQSHTTHNQTARSNTRSVRCSYCLPATTIYDELYVTVRWRCYTHPHCWSGKGDLIFSPLSLCCGRRRRRCEHVGALLRSLGVCVCRLHTTTHREGRTRTVRLNAHVVLGSARTRRSKRERARASVCWCAS